MSIEMESPPPTSLADVVDEMATWQRAGAPVPLHPGDVGWHWRFGAEDLAAALRVWRCGGDLVAVGMMDGAELIRMSIAPQVGDDTELATRLLADVTQASHGVAPGGVRAVEARSGAAFRGALSDNGWVADEAWTPLSRDLMGHVEDCGVRVEVVDAGSPDTDPGLRDRVAVQRAAFPNSTFTAARWRTMAAAPSYRRARCLVAYEPQGAPVAAVTVWSAGRGRPGLLEPMGVHQDHRGHGYGRAICVAAAAALQEMGSSTATVCTPGANVGAVATYESAGFRRLSDVTDFRRPDTSSSTTVDHP